MTAAGLTGAASPPGLASRRAFCAALGPAAFTVAASLTLLDFWRFTREERAAMRSAFIVNVGLLGGLIIAFGSGL